MIATAAGTTAPTAVRQRGDDEHDPRDAGDPPADGADGGVHQPVDGAVVLGDGEQEGDAGQDDEQVPREPVGDLVDLLVGGTRRARTCRRRRPRRWPGRPCGRAAGWRSGRSRRRAREMETTSTDMGLPGLGERRSAVPSCGNVTSVTRHTSMSWFVASSHGCGRYCDRLLSDGRVEPGSSASRTSERRQDRALGTGHRPPLPADPRPDQRARRGAAGDLARRPSTTAARSSPRSAATCSPALRAGLRHDARPGGGLPRSGTGAWEAALVNTLSPGDRVLAFETGHFATLWQVDGRARSGCEVDFVPGDWRHGADPDGGGGAARRGHRARDQGRLRGAQRDLDRRHQPGRRDPRGASTRPATRRCCSSTPSPRSARSTTATTSGASTSPWPARRRA